MYTQPHSFPVISVGSGAGRHPTRCFSLISPLHLSHRIIIAAEIVLDPF